MDCVMLVELNQIYSEQFKFSYLKFNGQLQHLVI